MKSSRLLRLAAPLIILLYSFLQRPGQTTFDTKFDLTADPTGFLSRSLTLWNPDASFGELQNQAYGYLFPQGAFFVLGDLLGLPDWVVQRLWTAVVLVLAYEGARRLYAAVADGPGRGADIVAGVAYAVAPRLLGLSGVLSAEVLPTAVLPWVVLPVVLGLRGHLTARSAGLLSGVAVLFMGGVNAVENLAALPVAFLVVLSGVRRPGGRSLLGWWVGAVAAASLWWMLPLLVFGRYSPPFLDYIETAEATTRLLGWANVTRGADHWVGFVTIAGEPYWPAAHALFTTWWGIAATAAVAGLGLAGLLRRDMPLRGPLVASLLLGLLCLSLGHGGVLGSPLAEWTRDLLNGPLAVLRNVHKVDPIVRLPLALGLGHLWARTLMPAAEKEPPRPQGDEGRRPVLRPVASGLVLALLFASALPLFGGVLRKPGWSEVPTPWQRAAEMLEAERGDGRVLVLPGSGFAEQIWGSTIDEPLQGIADVPWVARSQVPLAPGPTIRVLDALEDRVADGVGSPAFAEMLARSGITLVVVRRDLREGATDSPSPDRVDLALQRTPGLTSIASFGQSELGTPPMIEVFRVDPPSGADGGQDPRADVAAVSSVAWMAGDSGDVLSALEAGAVGAEQPVMFGGDGPPDVQADGYRRVERQFGRVHDAVSAVMSAGDLPRTDRVAFDYPGPEGESRVVRWHAAVQSMAASSSAGFVDTPGASVPERGPYSAVDGDPRTYWQSAPLRRPTGAWLEMRLREPVPVGRLELVAGVGAAGVSVREFTVQAGPQQVTAMADPVTGRAVATLDGSEVERIRVTVSATLGDPDQGVVAIREISYEGLATAQTLVLPKEGAGPHTAFALRASPPRRACVEGALGVSCEPFEARPGEAEDRLTRHVTVDSPGAWVAEGTVIARASYSTRRLLEPLGDAVRVRSSSVLAADPLVGPQGAYDRDPRTEWVASPGDTQPVLRLSWGERRTIDRIEVDPGSSGDGPATAVLQGGGEVREVDLNGSLGFFEPLRTDRLRITLLRDAGDVGSLSVSELRLEGLGDLVYSPDPDARTGSICGLGPPLVIDGRSYDTRVTGTIDDVRTGALMRLQLCSGRGGPTVVGLGSGSHRVEVLATGQYVPVSLALAPLGAPSAPPAGPDRPFEVVDWAAERREVEVGAGPESVLRIPENTNAGWRATLDGVELDEVVVDGWQQGYVVPAGDGGRVVVEFVPAGWYRIALGVGVAAALVLAIGAGLSLLRDRRRRSTVVAGVSGDPAAWLGGRLARAGLVVAAAVLAGPAVAGGALVTVVVRRIEMHGAVVAGALVALAGAVAAAGVHADVDLGAPADLLAGLAVGVTVGVCLPRPRGTAT